MKCDVTQVTETYQSTALLDTYGIDDRSYTCFLFFSYAHHPTGELMPLLAQDIYSALALSFSLQKEEDLKK